MIDVAGAVVFLELVHPEGVEARGAFGLLDLRAMDFDTIANLDARSIAFECNSR